MLRPLETGSRPRGEDTVRLLALIVAYQKAAARAVAELRAALAVDDLLAAWRANQVETSGRFETPTAAGKFEFHGVGCRIETGETVVDVDFGPEGRCDGFDVWRLSMFATDNPSEGSPFQDRAHLARSFERLAKAGCIVCPHTEPSPHLYYLADSDAAISRSNGSREKKK